MLLKCLAEDYMVHCCLFPHGYARVFGKSSAAGTKYISIAELVKMRQAGGRAIARINVSKIDQKHLCGVKLVCLGATSAF